MHIYEGGTYCGHVLQEGWNLDSFRPNLRNTEFFPEVYVIVVYGILFDETLLASDNELHEPERRRISPGHIPVHGLPHEAIARSRVGLKSKSEVTYLCRHLWVLNLARSSGYRGSVL